MARTLWGQSLGDMIHFLHRTKAPVISWSVVPHRPFSGKGLPETRGSSHTPGRVGPRSRGQATHQVDAIGVHAAQGPPAQVCVVVLGVSLHTTGVIASGAADKENSGSEESPCLAASTQNVTLLLATTEPPHPHSCFRPNHLTFHEPRIPVF